MAKRQTRRSVSLGVVHYTRLLEYAQANGASSSQVTEYARWNNRCARRWTRTPSGPGVVTAPG